MKAIVLKKFGDLSHFSFEELSLPEPKDGEVRIKIKAVGFNPVDYKTRKGSYPVALPVILGADCSGFIDKIGANVSNFEPGDEVIAFVFGQGSNGTYAEYVCIDASFVARKPKKLSFETAATIPLASLTAYRALINTGALQSKKACFIAGGSGGVGSIALQLARYFHAHPIFTTAGSEESVNYLCQVLKIPKSHVLNYRGLSLEQLQAELIKMNGGQLLPATFDLVGNEMKKLCFAVVDYSGHVASILPERKDFPLEVWNRSESIAFSKSLTVHFISIGAESFTPHKEKWSIYHANLKEIVSLIDSGVLVITAPTVVGQLGIEAVKLAHTLLEEGHVKGKLAMIVS